MAICEPIKRGKGRPSKGTWAYFSKAREAAGLTQTEVAEMCGSWQSQVGKWERGETAPDLVHIKPLSVALGVPLAEIAEQAALFFEKK